MRYTFNADQHLPFPLETVFAFFTDPNNLPRLMPSWQRARIDDAIFMPPAPPSPLFFGWDKIKAGDGTRMTITIRPVPFSPIRVPWVALIEDFRWLHGFCDVQVKGPFEYWRHCHTLEATATGTLL